MKVLAAIAREFAGLFVDDGSLALAILAWVGVIGMLFRWAGLGAGVAGALLFVGLVVILIENVRRRARMR